MIIQDLNLCQASLNRLQCLSGNKIKLIAAALMVIDHVTKVVFTAVLSVLFSVEQAGQLPAGTIMALYEFNSKVLCSLGAISFPIFCFMFTEGYYYTKSKARFALRLFLFALISEIPFDLAFYSSSAWEAGTFPFYWGHQNVFFSFGVGVSTLIAIDKLRTVGNRLVSLGLQLGAVFCFGKLAGILHCDYRIYGVLLMAAFYFFRKNRLFQILGALAVRFLLFSSRSYPLSFLGATGIILLYNGQRGNHRMKYFFYIFYPAHLLAVYLISQMIWLL